MISQNEFQKAMTQINEAFAALVQRMDEQEKKLNHIKNEKSSKKP